MYCSYCGTKVVPGTKFCAKCHASLQAETAFTTKEPAMAHRPATATVTNPPAIQAGAPAVMPVSSAKNSRAFNLLVLLGFLTLMAGLQSAEITASFWMQLFYTFAGAAVSTSIASRGDRKSASNEDAIARDYTWRYPVASIATGFFLPIVVLPSILIATKNSDAISAYAIGKLIGSSLTYTIVAIVFGVVLTAIYLLIAKISSSTVKINAVFTWLFWIMFCAINVSMAQIYCTNHNVCN